MYVFGEFVLDTQLFQLRLRDQIIRLEPKVFDVLRYLIEHRDRVATKRELLEALWPNEVVTEAVLPTNINALRRALGQKRGDKTPIETIHGRGYRFSMPVVETVPPKTSARPSHVTALALSDLQDDDTTPFVGRASLISRLKRCLVRTLGEQGQLCILSGEAGIGKTRLVSRVAELGRSYGAEVWTGVSPEGINAPPLWAFRQVLRCALQREGRDKLREWLGPGVPELQAWLPELLDGPAEAPPRLDQASFRLLDAVLRLLTQASLEKPRVICLEDMHRADDASWQLLGLLAPHLERIPALVLVTLRSRDDLTVAAPVQRNLDMLLRSPCCHTLYVRGLEEPETQELAERLLGRSVDAELAHLLQAKTGGNPLFVRELVEWLDASGSVDATTLRETAHLAPPEMIRHVLRRRVARLGETAQRVLEAGAVLGATWDVMSVVSVSGLSREAVLEGVDAALAHRTIVAVQSRVETFRFAHDLLRDTLRADLPTTHRKRLHLRAAASYEERLAWLGVQGVYEVAQHQYQALPDGDASVAIRWLARAAEESERNGAFSEAARYYRCAIDATRMLPVPNPQLKEKLSRARERASEMAASARRASQG